MVKLRFRFLANCSANYFAKEKNKLGQNCRKKPLFLRFPEIWGSIALLSKKAKKGEGALN
jgi:hypothetical protein